MGLQRYTAFLALILPRCCSCKNDAEEASGKPCRSSCSLELALFHEDATADVRLHSKGRQSGHNLGVHQNKDVKL